MAVESLLIYNFLFLCSYANVTGLFIFFQLRVYLRTTAFEQMVQASSSSAGLRAIKRVEQTLQDLGVCLFTVGWMLTELGI